MSALPFLPTEIINKINNMAYEMHRLDMIQLNQEIFKNNINTLIKSIKEDYDETEDFDDHFDSYGEFIIINYGIFDITFIDNDIIWN
tara:strand:- start:18 stop:278 length:261 start_codon:yes stop_codon:yes gene_type:complete